MNLFDILGPVMVGPSSSHTAGAVRIGKMARSLLGQPPARAQLLLHGSFASSGEGHGTHQALIAGLLDGTVEGVANEEQMILAVQHHPGSVAGSRGVSYLFTQFVDMMKDFMAKRGAENA